MGRLIVTVTVWLLLTASSSPARLVEALPQNDRSSTEAAKALEESYAFSTKLDEVDRIQFLNDMIIVAPDIAPDRVAVWSHELITLAQNSKVISDWARIAFQKNAIVALSKVDPAEAMRLFSKIGPPAPSAREKRLQEDVRAFGARTLFLNYFKAFGLQALPTLRQEAIRLVDTHGAYPFHAMSLILTQLPGMSKDGEQQADKLFADALKYYRCDSKVEDQHLEFFAFLQNAKSVVSKSLLVDAVRVFVDNLKDQTCDKRPTIDQYVAVIQTSKSTVELHDESKAILFRAFRLIKEIDPPSALKLQQDIPELAAADDPINQVAATLVATNASPEQKAAAKNLGLQQALLRGITSVRESNPQAALQMAQSLDDPASHIAAVASVLPSLAQSDMQQAKQLYLQELDELNSLPENPTKPQDIYWISAAMLWMAEAAHKSADIDNFQYLATKTFDDAVDQFTMSYATKGDSAKLAADSRPGYSELTELVEFAAAQDESWVLQKARDVQDLRLKVHLLMYAAKGLARRP